MYMETLAFIVGTCLTIAAVVAFSGIVIWACLRPHESVEADAHLWKDDEN